LQQREEDLSAMSPRHPVSSPVSVAILDGQQEYTHIDLPVLAIFNVPHEPAFLRNMESQERHLKLRFLARVVRIPNADHYVFQTNEADVLRYMNDFMGGLHLANVKNDDSGAHQPARR
jgi:hypothetical protein